MKNQLIEAIGDKLYISTTETVHPNILLRMPLFTPRKTKALVSTDATENFRELKIFQSEGYDSVAITGPTMTVSTDFKVWCGILFSFYKYGFDTDTITLNFTEFAKFCGYSSKRLDKSLRETIDDSLGRIAGQTIKFRTKSLSKSRITSLLLKGSFDYDEDRITLTADPDLWELYMIDHQILVSYKVLQKLPRAETSQCLYIYFASLPQDPYPISLSRLRERLQLSMSVKECNRSIKQAIAKLEKIGYLKGQWIEWKGEVSYKIYSRDRAMLPKGILD